MTESPMKRLRHAYAIATLAVAAALAAAPTIAGPWDGGHMAQAQKGRGGADRADRDRGREARPDRRDERRDRMSEDDRRSLQRDLDKANRELYGRRFGK